VKLLNMNRSAIRGLFLITDAALPGLFRSSKPQLHSMHQQQRCRRRAPSRTIHASKNDGKVNEQGRRKDIAADGSILEIHPIPNANVDDC
jgi:hypothetical protein